ncbi:MAG: tetratricopeptide repeat protein [Methylacidiphilales bacterium]|nr:tetratricopeptide repeat protein [Candidatus Methylacidiphilales bacterium]
MSGCRRLSPGARHPRCSVFALVIGLGLLAGGCAGTADITGALSQATDTAHAPRDWRQRADTLAERYRRDPGNPDIAIEYSLALRASGQRTQAAAVLQQASLRNPKNPQVAGAYGRALADNGQFEQALDALSRAHSPDQPDWRILNVQGAVLDQMGRNAEARQYYQQALAISPEEPSVLSNLGLSYVLSKELTQAESVLRRAAAQPRADGRVRQNLALVIGLQGRFEEAEQVVAKDLPPAEAQANVAYLREMLSQPNSWKQIGNSAAPSPNPAARRAPSRQSTTRLAAELRGTDDVPASASTKPVR